MSRSKKNATHKINYTVNHRQFNEPLIVIYNLNNKHDIKTAVETLLLNNELANSSSVFVVVPACDDNEDDESLYGSFNSTIGIQLSENYTQWLKNCNSDSGL